MLILEHEATRLIAKIDAPLFGTSAPSVDAQAIVSPSMSPVITAYPSTVLPVEGPLTTSLPGVKTTLHEVDSSIAIQNEGFENLIR